ncbi:MAG: HD domain-containing phosphohydrolase [Thermodesulfobacteriota bacterium]
MRGLKDYVINNFERVFILVILISVLVIYYFVPYKLAFLNVFYLPVLLSGYFSGRRYATLGAFLSILLVAIFFYYFPESFITGESRFDTLFKIILWGSFLLVAAYLTGLLHEKLAEENRNTLALNETLKETNKELEVANESLKSYTEDLDKKAAELREKNEVILHLKERIENALYSTMDSTLAKLIIERRVRNEKTNISVLFSDLVGFSTFSDKKRPEIVVEELNKYFGEMESIVVKYKGHIDKYLGDGMMCEFGAPVADYRLHALHAVVAGINMQDRLRDIKLPLRMRIGVSTGYAITGLIGQQKKSYTAIGDVVNLAKRLEEICPPSGIFVDEETLIRVKQYVNFERVRVMDIRDEHEEEYSRVKNEIESCLQELERNPKDVSLLYRIGKLYFETYDISTAIGFFKKALELDPDNNEVKIAYADATLNRDTFEKIEIKGRKERVAVYKILGLKDPLQDRSKIPESFYNQYKYVLDIIKVPYDVILPTEVIDGNIGSSKVGAIIAYAIASKLNLPDSEKERIMTAAFFRDIGKEMVPAYLLNREGTLTDLELKEIRKHTLEGVVTLQTMGYKDEKMLSYIRDHHERYDGNGYPNGKKGDEISTGARIVGIADSFNALISVRPYRDSWDRDMAVRELEREFMQDQDNKGIVDALAGLIS